MADPIASLRDLLIPGLGRTEIPTIRFQRNRSGTPSRGLSAKSRGVIQPTIRHIRIPALRACVGEDSGNSTRVRRKERGIALISDAQHRAPHMRHSSRPLLV